MNDLVYLDPITFIFRAYEPGNSFEQGSPYCASATIQFTGKKAFMAGLHGKISSAQYKALIEKLKEGGIETLTVIRKGKVKEYTL